MLCPHPARCDEILPCCCATEPVLRDAVLTSSFWAPRIEMSHSRRCVLLASLTDFYAFFYILFCVHVQAWRGR